MDMSARIQEALATIAQEEQVRIIYACESGSRAWGIASQNSDYDVRFLYVRPQNDYLRLDMPRDVIELPIVDDLDINGWDIFKALRLLRNSNPPLLEWLFSPIVYQESSIYVEALRDIARRLYSQTSIFYHYSNMAYRNYHAYIEQKDSVSLKKYLYVLRPIIALLYLQQHSKLAPTSFIQTMAAVQFPQEVRVRIEQLLVLKQAGEEMGMGDADPMLNAFIVEHLDRWRDPSFKQQQPKSSWKELDGLLLSILNEAREVTAER
ncbi:nucleotidyltransferase domain-containing protein [Dictyobacter kobayashii]|uniref:Nucleotidyltransferase n=1 Tax=Dictyobacter kobayashii TaxID=2014872 RepID=A0A402ATV9_9CHLR|nr:nucleotidyltransferase domain-containing protein [Dictyobacter kobayashii]GCE22552.1 nucleotidyltransferase [Dictyobacter kobayashii]